MDREPTVAVLCGFRIGRAETFLNVFSESAVSCYNVVGIVGCKMLNEYQVLECSTAFHTGIYEVDRADMYTGASAVLTYAVFVSAFLMVAVVIADSAKTVKPYVDGTYLSALDTRAVFKEVFTFLGVLIVFVLLVAGVVVRDVVCVSLIRHVIARAAHNDVARGEDRKRQGKNEEYCEKL